MIRIYHFVFYPSGIALVEDMNELLIFYNPQSCNKNDLPYQLQNLSEPFA